MAAVVVFVIIFSIDVATVKLLRLLHMLCYNKPCSLLLDVETHSAMSILCCSQLNLTVANCLYSIKFIHLLLFMYLRSSLSPCFISKQFGVRRFMLCAIFALFWLHWTSLIYFWKYRLYSFLHICIWPVLPKSITRWQTTQANYKRILHPQ